MFAAPDGLTPSVSFSEFLTEGMMTASAAIVIVHPNEHSCLYIKHSVVFVVVRLHFPSPLPIPPPQNM